MILTDLIYPPRCPICDRILVSGEGRICETCREGLPYIEEPMCKKCGKALQNDRQEYCSSCEKGRHYFIKGRAVFRYEKAFRRSVQKMKFQNRRDYLDFYADEMAAAGKILLKQWGIRTVIPVPLHPKKRRQRGFDQTRLLAQKFCDRTGAVLNGNSMKRIRYTLPQKELRYQQRQDNLKDAFILEQAKTVLEPVLLIDDIYTTGATMDELCRTLQKSGITDIYFLTLCAGNGK